MKTTRLHPDRLPLVMQLASLLLAVGAVYWRTLDYGLVGWDNALLRRELYAGGLSPELLGRILLPSGGTYQPVRELAMALLAQLPENFAWWPYHLLSLAAYGGTVIFFFLTMRVLLSLAESGAGEEAARWGAFAAAGLFALHPGHVEPVAWLLGQKDTLVGLCYLAAFYFYIRSRPLAGRDLLLSGGCFLLALGSKPSAASLPLLLALHDLAFRRPPFGPGRRGRAITLYAAFALPVIAGAAYYLSGVEILRPGGGTGATGFLHPDKVLGAVSFSLMKLLLPVNLCLRYPALESGGGAGLLALRVLPALLLFAATVLAWRRWRPASFFLLWFLAALLPNANLLLTPIERADRYYYLASAGLCGLGGWLIARLSAGASPRQAAWLRGLVLAALLPLGLIAWKQAGCWQDGPRAWGRVHALYPELTLARVALAVSWLELGDHGRALELYQPLLERRPPNLEALKGVARIRAAQGQPEAAARLLEEGLRLAPADRDFPSLALALGRALAEGGRPGQAEELYLRLGPERLEAEGLEFLAARAFDRGEYERARELFQALAGQRPADPRALNNLAVALERLGRAAAADSLYRAALALDRRYLDAWFNRGNLLLAQGRPAEALRHYLRADSLAGGDDPAVREALGRARRALEHSAEGGLAVP